MKKFIIFSTMLLFLCFLQNNAISEETLTWNDCLREAKDNHPDLISAEESINQEKAAKDITKSALYPQIDSSVTSSTTKTSTETTNKTTDTYKYGITGTQLLFDKSKTRADIEAASENIKAAQEGYRFTSSEVRLRLKDAFINLLKAQELLNITEEIYNIRRSNLMLVSLLYESGLEHKGSLLNAEANLGEAKFEITKAKRALEVTERELIKEMGRREFSPVRVEGVFKVDSDFLEKPDFEVLAKNNPSLGKLIAGKNAAYFGIKSAKADYFPTFSAGAGANRTSEHFPPEYGQWNTGLTLSFPLFEGGLRKAEVEQAKSIFRQYQADERSTKDGVVLALEEDWAALKDAVETIEVEKKFLSAAEERAKIAKEQYSLGLIKFDNWTIIEDDLVRSKKALLDAQANALLDEANWIYAKGETLEYAE